ncbi:DNA polymerase nu [Aplysia californica]|uniref:DNA polymerase nu n=1 Tax=Aplysia californica TaxID=6500 RepID=A0ABM0JBQ2_APLCA|nr:DNA polymerase nu [Aplysia californica]
MPDQSQDNIFQQHSEVGEENTGKNAAPKVDEFVNLLNLEKTTQKDVLRQIQNASTLSLSLLFLNGQALVNTFSTNHDKTKGLLIHSEDLSYKTLYLPFESNGTDLIRQTMLKSLSNENCMKTIVNSKDFLIVLHRHIGVENDHCIRCEKLDDPVIASWLLQPENPPSTFTDMASLVAFSGTEDINDTNWHSCLKHVARLSAVLKEELFRRQLLTLYSRVEMKLVPLLACMETRSVKMDTKLLVRFSDLLKTKLEKLEQQVYKEIGHTFSLTSHPQLRQVLYEELKLDQKLTGKVKIGKTSVCQEKSTGESTLRLLAEVHPLPSLVLEYRQLQKLKSTYVDGMKACVRDGSLSTHWDQTAAATGRLTSCQPNVQAVPKVPVVVTDYKNSYVLGDDETCSTEIYAREPFVAAQGNVFLSADFQQIELRILAHLSGDSALLSMFWRPQAGDIFTSLYSQWHNKPIESVTSDDREQTKRMVYSVMYGVGKEKLADYLKVKADIAKEIMNSFLRKFPAIESFSKKCCEYAEEFGYTETLCGRRRYFTHISHRAPGPRAYAQRQAVNFCVQGSAADICKMAMLAVEEKLRENSHLRARLLLQIHDELLWELPEDQIEETKGLIQRVMEDPRAVCGDLCSLQVPLPVSLSVGKSWAHLTPVQSHPPPAPL